MHFVDSGELLELIAMWLQGFWMATQVKGVHAGGIDDETMHKLVGLIHRYEDMKKNGFSDWETNEYWLLDVVEIAPKLWD